MEFNGPSLSHTGPPARYEFYALAWTHPDHNAKFRQYYLDEPGDLPTFVVRIDENDAREEQVEGLEGLENLVDCVNEAKEKPYC